MGQFLFIGLNTQITFSRKAYRGPDLSREEIEKELGSYLFDSEIYEQSATEEMFTYSLKREVAEAEWLPFLKDFYAMRYADGRGKDYADEILKILSESGGFDEWIDIANQCRHEIYQSDRRNEYLWLGKRDSLYAPVFETVLLSMDGKIVMECYGSILRFFTECVRERLKQYKLAKALSVYIY